MSSDSPKLKPTILIQLDTDPQPSVFDAVVAVDSGVDHLFRHGGVTVANVRDLVYGGLFTRGLDELHRTAIFIGGSNVEAGEAVLEAVKQAFFGEFRLSVLLDANGANTTAAASVLAASRSLGGSLTGVKAAVLGATGPVGLRAARLLGTLGAEVLVGSRRLDRAEAAVATLSRSSNAKFQPFAGDHLREALADTSLVISAGASGTVLLPLEVRQGSKSLKVAIDLNAVPPSGIEGIKPTDKEKERDGLIAWGALGVGGIKMKIHKKAIQALFQKNDQVLDAEAVLAIGQSIL